MGRPIKDGVDYFSLDCHMSDSVKLIEAEFGLKGFAIIIKLWQKIYSEKGYYTKWSRPVALMFAQSLNVGINVVEEVVNASIREGIFNQRLYKEYGILTSERIQETYASITRKRDFVKFEKGYLLIATPKNWVSSAENGVNSAENEVMGGQSKVKESKEKNSITTTTAPVREKKANTEALGYHVPPERESVVDYFKKLGVSEPEGEADAFIKYNEGLGWVCLPVWVTAADSWAEKIRPRRKGKKRGSGELARSFDTGEFFDAATSRTYKGKGGKG